MVYQTLTVRNVDKLVYKRFKQTAIDSDMTLGHAITEAMELWLDYESKLPKTNPKNLLKLNGIIKVGKKVNWSEHIDEIVYGGK